MSTQHTPGPWTIADDLDRIECIGIYGGTQLVAEIRDPETIKLDERAVEEAMMRSNAHLIAAAPELLEALRLAQNKIAYLSTKLGKRCPLDLSPVNTDNAVRNAIAKAEGRI